MKDKHSRAELIDMVEEFRDPSSSGRRGSLARALQEALPGADVLNLCQSDIPSNTIVDVCLGFEQTKRTLNTQELVKLVSIIRSAEPTSEAEEMLMIESFLYNCRNPAGTDLIYFPEGIFGEGVAVTPEMIVAKALSIE